MIYSHLIEGIKRFGSSEKDICAVLFNCHSDSIQKNVVLAPWWEPSLFDKDWLEITEITQGKVWNIKSYNVSFTYIRTGIGAPLIGDASLALGCTQCENVIFIGSVGALSLDMSIGDIVIPKESFCGDGFSRYLTKTSIKENNCFGDIAYPNKNMFERVLKCTENICENNGVNFHIGKVFSIDSIFAQFAHIDEIINSNCDAIEMETAAFFKVMELNGINAGAILQVSDNTIVEKSLYSGRTEEEQNYRKHIRKTLFPQIIEKTFESFNVNLTL